MLDLPKGSIQKVEVKNGEISPLELSGKTCRLDLNLTVNNMAVNVEMQVAPTRDFADRALFYWSEIFVLGGEQGVEYGRLQKAITVNLLNYTMFEDDRFYREYVPADLQAQHILSDKMQIKFFEMTKVPSAIDGLEKDSIKVWLQLLKSNTKEELDMLGNASSTPEIKRAAHILYDMSADERIRESVRARKWADFNAQYELKAAVDAASKEGEIKQAAKMVDKLVQNGYSFSDALAFVEITEEAYRQAKQVTGE